MRHWSFPDAWLTCPFTAYYDEVITDIAREIVENYDVDAIFAAADDLGVFIATMVDTKGIEIRTGRLSEDYVSLDPGSRFTLYTGERVGDATGVSVSYRRLDEEVRAGVPILLDDGAMELEVESVEPGSIRCQVIHGGLLRANKSVNLPQTQLSLAAVSPEHRQDVVKELRFAIEHEVDYIAASFVQSADDLERMREILHQQEREIPIIAKIENKAGVDNLDEIVAVTGLELVDDEVVGEGIAAHVDLTDHQHFRKFSFNLHRGKVSGSTNLGLLYMSDDGLEDEASRNNFAVVRVNNVFTAARPDGKGAGYQFIAYGTDAVFLYRGAQRPGA